MSALIGGVLLPVGVLSEPWFTVFTAFVGFNTLVYAGLTFAKLLPLPPIDWLGGLLRLVGLSETRRPPETEPTSDQSQ